MFSGLFNFNFVLLLVLLNVSFSILFCHLSYKYIQVGLHREVKFLACMFVYDIKRNILFVVGMEDVESSILTTSQESLFMGDDSLSSMEVEQSDRVRYRFCKMNFPVTNKL